MNADLPAGHEPADAGDQSADRGIRRKRDPLEVLRSLEKEARQEGLEEVARRLKETILRAEAEARNEGVDDLHPGPAEEVMDFNRALACKRHKMIVVEGGGEDGLALSCGCARTLGVWVDRRKPSPWTINEGRVITNLSG